MADGSVPDTTNWSEWGHARALQAVTGDVVDMRGLSRAEWFTFNPLAGGNTWDYKKGAAPALTNELSYHAFGRQYFGADVNHAAVDRWETTADQLTAISNDLEAGVRGSMDVRQLAALQARVVELETWLDRRAGDYRTWADNLAGGDGFRGSAAWVLQQRLDQYARMLERWRDRLRTGYQLPLSQAVANAHTALTSYDFLMWNGWSTALDQGVRHGIRTAINAEIEGIYGHLRTNGLIRGADGYVFDSWDPWRQNPDGWVSQSVVNAFLKRVDDHINATLASHPRGDLRTAAAWIAMSRAVTDSVKGQLDALDRSAGTAIRGVRDNYVVLTEVAAPLPPQSSTGVTPPGPGGSTGPNFTPPNLNLTPPNLNFTPPNLNFTPPNLNLTPPDLDLTPPPDLTSRGQVGGPGGLPGGGPGGLSGGMPGGFPGGEPGGLPGGFPGGEPGGLPGGEDGGGPGGVPGGFPGGEPGGFPGGEPGGWPGGLSGGLPGGGTGGGPGDLAGLPPGAGSGDLPGGLSGDLPGGGPDPLAGGLPGDGSGGRPDGVPDPFGPDAVTQGEPFLLPGDGRPGGGDGLPLPGRDGVVGADGLPLLPGAVPFGSLAGTGPGQAVNRNGELLGLRGELLGPDGEPVLGEFGELLGRDGLPLPGASGQLLAPGGGSLLGPEGELLGLTGDPLLGRFGELLGPDGAPLLGLDGELLGRDGSSLAGADGRLVGPDGQPVAPGERRLDAGGGLLTGMTPGGGLPSAGVPAPPLEIGADGFALPVLQPDAGPGLLSGPGDAVLPGRPDLGGGPGPDDVAGGMFGVGGVPGGIPGPGDLPGGVLGVGGVPDPGDLPGGMFGVGDVPGGIPGPGDLPGGVPGPGDGSGGAFDLGDLSGGVPGLGDLPGGIPGAGDGPGGVPGLDDGPGSGGLSGGEDFRLDDWGGRIGVDGPLDQDFDLPLLTESEKVVGSPGTWPPGQAGPLPTQMAGSPVARGGAGPFGSGPAGSMPYLPPMMGGLGGAGGGRDDRRERRTWLSEDHKVWGTHLAPGDGLVGRPDDEPATVGTDEFVLPAGPVRQPRRPAGAEVRARTEGWDGPGGTGAADDEHRPAGSGPGDSG